MSLDPMKRRIVCDNRDCAAYAPFPTDPLSASADLRAANGAQSPAAGWVFVAGTYEDRHYCPRCGSKMLPECNAVS